MLNCWIIANSRPKVKIRGYSLPVKDRSFIQVSIQTGQGLVEQLPDTLARQAYVLAYLFQGQGRLTIQAKTQPENLGLAVADSAEQLGSVLDLASIKQSLIRRWSPVVHEHFPGLNPSGRTGYG